MKKITASLFFIGVFSFIQAQDCTKQSAAAQPSSFEKATGYNGNGLQDPVLKKTTDELNNMIIAAIKNANGLHGFYDASKNSDGAGGLSAFKSRVFAYVIYCQKGGGYNWKGMWGFKIECIANSIMDMAESVSNEDIGTGPNHNLCINNNPIYITNRSQSHSQWKGYPYFDDDSQVDGILVTKPRVALFRAVIRKDYLLLMKKNQEALVAKLKKDLADLLKQKAAATPGSDMYKVYQEAEGTYTKTINDAMADQKEIDRFTASQNDVWLNKPCITNHRFDLVTHSFDKDYFQDAGENQWVIINPDYINKKVPATAPQFFYLRWIKEKSSFDKEHALAEINAIAALKSNFDFAKLAALLK